MARRLYHFVPVSLTEKHTRISVARQKRNDIHKQQPRRILQLFSRVCWRKSALWAFSGRGYESVGMAHSPFSCCLRWRICRFGLLAHFPLSAFFRFSPACINRSTELGGLEVRTVCKFEWVEACTACKFGWAQACVAHRFWWVQACPARKFG